MSKVVLLAINAKYVHSSLAVRVLAGGIRKYARLLHDVVTVEAATKLINEIGGEIAESIVCSQPDVIGISTYIWNAGKLPEFMKMLRERLPDTVFVLGGPEASFNAEYWLKNGADYVLTGEGEYSFPPLLDELSERKTAAGAVRGENGAPGTQPETNPGYLPIPKGPVRSNEPIDPYEDCTIDGCYNITDDRILYLETSRGCPFNCAFCLSAGSGVRFFPLETAKKQLYKLSKSGAQTIKLVDRTFNCDAGRAYELFEYVAGLDTKCSFHFEVAADMFNERTLELLSRAPPGRIRFEAGLQSFFIPALKASTRRTDLEKAEQNIRALLRGRNIHILVDLIAGLPYETLIDFQNSFDRAYALNPHALQLGFLKLLHGSELRRQAAALGIFYSEEPPYVIQNSPWLSAEDVQTLKHAENALQHTYNKGRFLSVLEYALSAAGLRPFSIFRGLGAAAPNHGAHLADYAARVYEFFAGLPGVDRNTLRDRMIIDWLGMVKGKNIPDFLRIPDKKLYSVKEMAKKQLAHGIRRGEAAVLRSGTGIFVDSEDRDPVTGLYRVYYTP